MRVLLIHQNYVDHKHPGGTRHLDFAKHFGENGHATTIVASTVDYLTGTIITENEQPPFKGVKVHRAYAIPTVQKKNLLWRAISFISFAPFSFIKAWRSGPTDVVLGTSPPLFQLPSPWLIAKIRRVPFVLEILDLWPEFAIGMGVLKNPFLIKAARIVEHFFYDAASHLVVNSPAFKTYLVEHGIAAEKITVVPMGVELDFFDPAYDGSRLKSRLGLDGKFVATYAGALGLANDLDTIIHAAVALKDRDDIHFLFAGDGNQRTHLESLVAEHELKNVTFGGFFPKEEMKNVLAASDACLATLRDIPEFRTPYPNKVFDYMAAGRPIVLGIAGAIQAVVEEANAGICVPPGDASALADAVRRLADDAQLTRRFGESGRKFVESNFSSRIQAAKFESVLVAAVQNSSNN